jgi:Flp pilus assembly protein TadB
MKPIDFIMLALGAAAEVTAILEWAGVVTLRVEAPAMSLIGIVFIGRVVLRLKLQSRERQRQMMLNEVPRRPLGLDDQP